jgi:hypothetical protein
MLQNSPLKKCNKQADKWIDPSAQTQKWLHPIALQRLYEELCDISYMDANDAIESYFIEPLEQWGLLEVDRIKEGYSEKIKCIRKSRLFDAFIRFEA